MALGWKVKPAYYTAANTESVSYNYIWLNHWTKEK